MMIFIYIIFLLIPSICFAAPSISSVAGSVIQNNSIIVSGSSFGTNGLNIQSLNTNIESGTVGQGFSLTGWTATTADSETSAVLYDNTQAHSGSKSLKIDFNGPVYKGYFTRDNGGEISKLYATWWVRAVRGTGEEGQWKVFRISHQSSPTDTTPEIALFAWQTIEDNGPEMINRPINTTSKWNDINTSIFLETNESPGQVANYGMWTRIEFYFEGGTQGNADGTFRYWFHDPVGNVIRNPINYPGNLLIYGASQTNRIRYMIMGHYVGDGYGNLVTWWDDVFLQTDGPQRVEIGDNATFSSCTHREIQTPTAWADGSITVTVNRGSFALGATAYLFVIDSAGAASSGYEITFSYGGGVALTGGTGSITTGGNGSLTW